MKFFVALVLGFIAVDNGLASPYLRDTSEGFVEGTPQQDNQAWRLPDHRILQSDEENWSTISAEPAAAENRAAPADKVTLEGKSLYSPYYGYGRYGNGYGGYGNGYGGYGNGYGGYGNGYGGYGNGYGGYGNGYGSYGRGYGYPYYGGRYYYPYGY